MPERGSAHRVANTRIGRRYAALQHFVLTLSVSPTIHKSNAVRHGHLFSRWLIGPCIAATATIYGELSGTGKSDIMMKKLCAFTILLISMCTMPALAGPNHKKHVESHRPAAVQVGTASWYGRWHAGRLTANGERFNPQAMTCAHRTLPLGSVVKVDRPRYGEKCRVGGQRSRPLREGRIWI